MPLKDTPEKFGPVTVLLHWLVAVAILGLFGLGLWMVSLDYYHNWYRTAPHIHKSVGILLFAMMILRSVWRLFNSYPEKLPEVSVFDFRVARIVHHTMYLLIFFLLISGYLIPTADGTGIEVFNWFEVPAIPSKIENQQDLAGEIHRCLSWLLIGLVTVHSLAALFHHSFRKNRTLKRMLGL